ncbi:hypothetical protein [Pseudarthrobacter phenanthrenivorans]|uniref:hypothetical protein n=1 Tax=Pseudarthrobacter phenanthrenivorans TaxID=361575 RepID=UPI0015E8766A|nr:hypothetical protein [Pseudarthrobacter phenanthrenivorans]
MTLPTSSPSEASQPHEDALAERSKKFGITAEDYLLPAWHQIQMLAAGLPADPGR